MAQGMFMNFLTSSSANAGVKCLLAMVLVLFGIVAPSSAKSAMRISAGVDHSCVIPANSTTVTCWGSNKIRSGPALSPTGAFTQLATGIGNHECGIKTDGTVACWDGWNSEMTPPAGTLFKQVTVADSYSCGLKVDGTVACWGGTLAGNENAVPAGTFLQVAAGHGRACGLRTGGTVECWATNSSSSGPRPQGTFTQITLGRYESCGLRSTGKVECWNGSLNIIVTTPPTDEFAQVSVGDNHKCGIKKIDGALVCWGNSSVGQTQAPSGSYTQIAAGFAHTCALRTDDKVMCWGYNGQGQTATPGSDLVWVGDALPGNSRISSVGNFTTYANEPFNLQAGTTPPPYTGSAMHQSPSNSAPWRQHYFTTSVGAGLNVKTGDTLYTYVHIDPANRPSEIMLQWHGPGGWEHRAYWAAPGVNSIPWGNDGTNARRYMGGIPPTVEGEWVRLNVPASAVGLENATVDGMAFVAYGGGTVTWDDAGVNTPSLSSICNTPGCDVVWVSDGLPLNSSTSGKGSPRTKNVAGQEGTYSDEAFNWVGGTTNGTIPGPYAGSFAHQSPPSSSFWRQHYFTVPTSSGFSVGANDTLFTYVYLDPSAPPSEIMLQWLGPDSWEHRAYWGTNNIPWGTDGTNSRRRIGDIPARGQWVRLEVPASAVGLNGPTVSGMAFVSYGGGTVIWDNSGKRTP